MDILQDYKVLAKDKERQIEMLKNSSCTDFLVYSLDTEDSITLDITLDILKLFIENENTHVFLKSSSALLENMRLIENRKHVSKEIKQKAKDLHSKLFNVPSTPNNSNVSSPKKVVQNTFMFHVQGLYSVNEDKLESAIIRLKGVISIQVDAEHQRCVVRTTPTLDQLKIAEQIVQHTNMKPRLVSKNKRQQEVFIDILNPTHQESTSEDFSDEENLPAYLPEEDEDEEETYHPKSILSFQYIKANASTLMYSAARIINSIYC